MDSPTHLQYLISGRNLCGRVSLGRDTPQAALKKAREFLQEGYLDVRISTPRAGCCRPKSSISSTDRGRLATAT
jgi:hypothetical protein